MASGGESTSETRATVLVVDDEQSYLDAYESHLREEHEVRTASGGQAALTALDEAVDVVLLDRRMPDLSGERVLRAARERGLDCRVAMVTAVEPDVDLVELPCDDYLIKPVGGEELRDTVAVLVRLGTVEAELQECYTLAAKKATIEGNVAEEALAESEGYETLTERLDALEAEVDEAIRDLVEGGAVDAAYRAL
jgi:DNA-binding response OmpR family regulator